MKKLLTILILLIGCLNLSATNYYVAITGTDENDGSSGSPFLTIQKAADVVNPGNTVIVRDGTYAFTGSVQVNIAKAGTAEGHITFRAEHKWGAVLDGQENADGTAGGQYCFTFSNNASYIDIKDFEIKNFRLIAFIRGYGTTNNYITIEGNKIHDIGRYPYTDGNGRNAILAGNGNLRWTITKNLVYNIGNTGSYDTWSHMNKDHFFYSGTGNGYHTITYNIVWGCTGCALNLLGNGDFIANNVFAWSAEGSAGGANFIWYDSGTINITIANNIFYQPPTGSLFAIQPGDADVIGWSVKNNMVYGGRMWGDYYGAGCIAAMDGGNYGQTDCENAEVDPLFVSAILGGTPYDFHLQAGSPAIDAGVDVGLTTDYYNHNLRGLPDLGAIEDQGTVPLYRNGSNFLKDGTKFVTPY